MKETEDQNPGATMYTHWMKPGQENARTALKGARETMNNYYDRKAIPQPDIEIGDLVIWNAKKP